MGRGWSLSQPYTERKKNVIYPVSFLLQTTSNLSCRIFYTGLSTPNVVNFLFVLLLSADFNKKHFQGN